MAIHAANHRRITMPHQLGNRGNSYAIQNCVRCEGVAEFIGANIPQAQLFAQAFHLQADCIRCPRLAVTVDENKLGLRAASQNLHDALHEPGQMVDARLIGFCSGLVFGENPTIIVDLIPFKISNLTGASSRLPQREEHQFERRCRRAAQSAVFLFRGISFARLGLEARHALNWAFGEQLLLNSPIKYPMNVADGVELRGYAPLFLSINPLRDVVRAQILHAEESAKFGEFLQVESVTPIGFRGLMPLGPLEIGIAERRDADFAGLGSFRDEQGKLVELFFGQFFVFSAFGELMLLAPPKVTIQQPVCLRNHAFGERAMIEPSGQCAFRNLENVSG